MSKNRFMVSCSFNRFSSSLWPNRIFFIYWKERKIKRNRD